VPSGDEPLHPWNDWAMCGTTVGERLRIGRRDGLDRRGCGVSAGATCGKHRKRKQGHGYGGHGTSV